MGLLDYYKQFEGMSDEEVNEGLRQRAAEERARALARVPTLDLSQTTWPELPHSEVVNAVTYAARRGLHDDPDRHAEDLRRALGERHGIDPRRVVVGHGIADLLTEAARFLLGPGDELVTPWPSYPLYPLIARRAGGRAVAVAAGLDPDALLAAVTDRTRVLVLCNPNDPTGAWLPSEDIGTLLARLPEHVTVLLDEALADFVDAEPPDATLRLLDAFPRLLVLRTFSKAWGLAGLRCGYALGGPGSEPLLEAIAPPLGVGELQQAGALAALRSCGAIVAARRATVAHERRRLAAALADLPVDAPPSQANLVWLAAPGLTGADLAARLERHAVLVAPGGSLGAEDHVRAAIQSAGATDRLVRALERALG